MPVWFRRPEVLDVLCGPVSGRPAGPAVGFIRGHAMDTACLPVRKDAHHRSVEEDVTEIPRPSAYVR